MKEFLKNNTYDHNQDPLTKMHIDAKWVEHSHAYSCKMGERVKLVWKTATLLVLVTAKCYDLTFY